MVKQVQLALFTKCETGSKLLVGVLNKLGHSPSYPELNAVGTDVANIHSDVPPSLIPQTITTYVYDNCDHNPESQFGATMHCTDGIAIQERVLFKQPATMESEQAIQAKRHQLFYQILMEIEPYIQGETTDPPCLTQPLYNDFNETSSLSKIEDALWFLGRHISGESNMRVLPGWTGFYYLVSRDVPTQDTHNIAYLPTIKNPATEMGTVMVVLRQVFHRSRVLGLVNADLVLDHAIYAKAFYDILITKT